MTLADVQLETVASIPVTVHEQNNLNPDEFTHV